MVSVHVSRSRSPSFGYSGQSLRNSRGVVLEDMTDRYWMGTALLSCSRKFEDDYLSFLHPPLTLVPSNSSPTFSHFEPGLPLLPSSDHLPLSTPTSCHFRPLSLLQ
jgi:hypothetical protein